MKAILILDYSHNMIKVVEIDEEEFQEEFEGDLEAYASCYAESNTFEWMLIDDNTKVINKELLCKLKEFKGGE